MDTNIHSISLGRSTVKMSEQQEMDTNMQWLWQEQKIRKDYSLYPPMVPSSKRLYPYLKHGEQTHFNEHHNTTANKE